MAGERGPVTPDSHEGRQEVVSPRPTFSTALKSDEVFAYLSNDSAVTTFGGTEVSRLAVRRG